MEESRMKMTSPGKRIEKGREPKSKYGIGTKSCGIVRLRNCYGPLQLQMVNTRKEIEEGCLPHSKAINAQINTLLKNELHALLIGEMTPLEYLERCSWIVRLKNQGRRASFERIRRNEKVVVPDKMKRILTNIARKMAEELNQHDEDISTVVVFKPIIRENWFVRDFLMIEWDVDGAEFVFGEDKKRLVVPKDPETRQTYCRTLSIERLVMNRQRIPKSRKAVAKYVCENIFSGFSDEWIEVAFDDDFSLVNDEVTTSFIRIRDGEFPSEDAAHCTPIGTSAPPSNSGDAIHDVVCLQNSIGQSQETIPRPFCLPSFACQGPVRRFFDPGNLPDPRRNISERVVVT